MRLNEAIDAYLLSRQGQGYSVNTQRNNRRALALLVEVAGNMEMRHVRPVHVDHYVARMDDDGTQAPTINNRVSDLGRFFRWCRANGIMPLQSDPVGDRRPRPLTPKERMRVPMSDFPRLLDAASNPRNRMVIALGLYLFLRQSEILTLRVGDVDLASSEITVRIHKTRDLDVMPISAELDAELRRYFAWYSGHCGPLEHDWFLTPTMTMHRIYQAEEQQPVPTKPAVKIENVVKSALVACGYPVRDDNGATREGLHTLRRSGARALFDELRSQGYDGALRQVQTWLHHAQSTMTEKYLGLGLEREIRNRLVKGQPLYKSLADQDVVPIRRVV